MLPKHVCFYRLKISENIEIKRVIQSKAFFHLINTLYKSCFIAFNRGSIIPDLQNRVTKPSYALGRHRNYGSLLIGW